jgi:hypothetical protein
MRRNEPKDYRPGIAMLLLLAGLALCGTMDYQDQRAVSEFRQEWRIVVDAQGEPQLVPVGDCDELLLYGLVEDDDGEATKAGEGETAVRVVRAGAELPR